jgi:hypothetical protein
MDYIVGLVGSVLKGVRIRDQRSKRAENCECNCKLAEDVAGYRRRSMGRRTIPARGMGRCKDPESGKLLDRERDNWKPNLTVVKAAVQFFKETGRLTYQPEEGQVG